MDRHRERVQLRAARFMAGIRRGREGDDVHARHARRAPALRRAGLDGCRCQRRMGGAAQSDSERIPRRATARDVHSRALHAVGQVSGLVPPGFPGIAGAVPTARNNARVEDTMATRLIEVRSYKLKPGTAAAFHATAVSSAVPLLREWGTDVVAFGPSAHEPDTYFLIRAYKDLADLKARQAAFYGSDAWKNGPSESI